MTRRSAGRHAVVTLAGQWIRYVVQIVALVLFSRVLDPSDFGLVSMVTSVVGVAYVIGDVGLSLAALQARDLTAGQRSNLWWITSAIGIAIGLVVWGLSPALAALYDRDAVAPVATALAGVFVANGFGGQFRTELNRAQRFTDLAMIDVIAQLAGLAAGVVVIVCGGSYWGLVVQQLVAAWGTTAMLAARAGWWPGWPDRTQPMRSLLRFGLFTFGAQVVNYVSSNADAVIIGHRWGASTLGFYNRAFQVARMPVQQVAAPLTRVVLPHLVRHRDDPAAFSAAVARGQLVLATILLGALSVIAATAPSLTSVALGPGWDEAVPLIRALCLAAALQSLQYIYYWILLAHGRTEVLFGAELGARIAMVALMLVAAPHGALWVALAAAAGQALLLASNVALVGPRVQIAAGPLLRQASRPVAVFGAACALTWAVSTTLPSWSAVPTLLVLLVVWGAVCAATLVLAPVRRDGAALVAYGRSVLGRS
ncbi:lipopolysaccharide biosynthesis protein [Nocardioides sp.]|uniref:lipopolysaccharide biosynthesis protein n=1 Tax=Nocardioides sp. TaxID=35761 RepID=UPI002617260D|nr:lipopolysaccharide biosynthesis protein [Nocardioides sp.]